MGYTTYSTENRTLNSVARGYEYKDVDEIFIQQKERKAHKDMMPTGVEVREARDSDAHPNTVPVQLYLDVTGSMGHIPHQFIKNGLPTMISTIIQRGVKDVALMFGAIGDHECDNFPLQVAQFESGDEELDMWLERTYLEGRGGGNEGESYGLAWYFAGNHVVTDANKRGKKGFVFTIGDEPFLRTYPQSALKTIMGQTCKAQGTLKAEELLAQATKFNHVYHIHLNHGFRYLDPQWKQLLGDNLIVMEDYTQIPNKIAEIVATVSLKDRPVLPKENTEVIL